MLIYFDLRDSSLRHYACLTSLDVVATLPNLLSPDLRDNGLQSISSGTSNVLNLQRDSVLAMSPLASFDRDAPPVGLSLPAMTAGQVGCCHDDGQRHLPQPADM